MTLDFLKNMVSTGRYHKAGCDCEFFSLSDILGVKSWRSENLRNECYDMQRFLAKHGLAPKPYGMFESGKFACYITELATTMHNYMEKLTYEELCQGFWYNASERHALPAVRELCAKTQALGFGYYDTHSDNYGMMPDGRAVWIDMGSVYPIRKRVV